MRVARFGSVLLGLGLVVGVVASIGLLVGFEPAQLPRALLNIAAYKLAFAAALGLMIAGAMVVRVSRRAVSIKDSIGDPGVNVRELNAAQRNTSPSGRAHEPQPVREKRPAGNDE